MTVSTEVDEVKNLIIHHFSESVNLESILKTIENAVNNPKYKPGMNAIWVCEDGTVVDMTSEETRKVSECARKAFDKNGVSYKLALVANDDLAYGMNRVYEGWSNDRPIKINTFRKIEQAFNWMEE
jgi:hypothetical protein